MKLIDIVDMISDIADGMEDGSIAFRYDALKSAMKPCTPCAIYSTIEEIYEDAIRRKEPSREALERTLARFRDFKEAYGIAEMDKPIAAMEEYLRG